MVGHSLRMAPDPNPSTRDHDHEPYKTHRRQRFRYSLV